MMVIIIIYHPTVNQQAVEALGQQPVPDENADAVMGAHTNGSFAECFFYQINQQNQNGKPNLSEVLEVLREGTPAQKEAASEGNQW